jgi:drug/metabolite transporter superfamily protein YnfA
MRTLRGWIVMSWIMLPGVMFGGSLLLRRVSVGDPDAFQATWLRAFHAHGGVLIMLSMLYVMFLDRTTLSKWTKHVSCLILFVGIGAQVSGFLVHAIAGQPGRGSPGTIVTVSGAALMTMALIVLVYGLVSHGMTDDNSRGRSTATEQPVASSVTSR